MIRIGMDPNILSTGAFTLSWHGVLTIVGVVLAIFLIALWASKSQPMLNWVEQYAKKGKAKGPDDKTKRGMAQDIVYSVAVWAILGGILGARLVHVIDRWDFYGQNPGQIVAVWSGGIAIYGAVLGGFVGGAIYCRIKKFPVGILADITAPALILAMAVGRIGDIINGEHLSKTTTMAWGFVYSHPSSLSNQVFGYTPTHPAVVYEMIWDLLVMGMLWKLRARFHPHGMLFILFLALYSLGRFTISFLREDKVWLGGLTEAHIIAIVIMAVAVPVLVYKAQWVKKTRPPAGAVKKRRTG